MTEWAPFSETALRSIHTSDRFINIFEGAVRSSKTVASTVAWLDFLRDSPHAEFLMTGVTLDTLYRNVIGSDHGILAILGQRRAQYKKAAEGGAVLQLKLGGRDKVAYCVGVPNAKAESKIRGMTIGGWYADETTLYPEQVVKQAINRMSLKGARAFWTMNPDSPFHYLKREYIDPAAEKGYRHYHFALDDNLALPEDYKANLKRAYSGLWYKRMVEGLWVLAEGTIYDMFSAERMVVDELPTMQRHWIGVDYGTSNATTFLLFGLGVDRRLYLIDEYYHSGSEAGHSKSPSRYAAEFTRWLARQKVQPERIFIDPSAEGFMLELWGQGVKRIAAADNAVKRGIELTTNVIDRDLLRVHRRCEHSLKEFASYAWDPKAQERGEDKPLKINDHCMDPLRYVINGTRQIWNRGALGAA